MFSSYSFEETLYTKNGVLYETHGAQKYNRKLYVPQQDVLDVDVFVNFPYRLSLVETSQVSIVLRDIATLVTQYHVWM